MTWDEFKKLFLEKFSPQTLIDQITEEFLQLKQGEETVDQITGIFYDKAKFCPDLWRTERMWVQRYHSMLRPEIREFISPSKCATLQEVITYAREREIELKKQAVLGEKRKGDPVGGSSKSKRLPRPRAREEISNRARVGTVVGHTRGIVGYARNVGRRDIWRADVLVM